MNMLLERVWKIVAANVRRRTVVENSPRIRLLTSAATGSARFSKTLLAGLIFFARSVLGAGGDDFVTLFNGRDLSGWVNVNCAPETWSVSNGVIHCTGRPIGALRTTRQFENYVLELEWRHLSSGGNSGVFIWATGIAAPGVPFLRGIEVQVLDHGFNVPGKNEWYTTHGDVFPIHGASMKPFGRHNGMRSFPSEERSKGSPEWNHYRIECTNGVLRLHVNGKEVSGGEECNYRKGYIGLESEGAPVEFRNIRIQEFPSSGAGADLSAPVEDWKSLFTGLDLRGWMTNAATASRWRVEQERIRLSKGTPSSESTLWSSEEFGDAEFIVDLRPEKGTAEASFVVKIGERNGRAAELKLDAVPGEYRRFEIAVQGRECRVKTKGKEPAVTILPERIRFALGLADTGVDLELMNLYVRELSGAGQAR